MKHSAIPTETLEDGGMLWLGDETVAYTNAYRAAGSNTGFYRRSAPGSIIPIPQRQQLQGWHLITGYIDRNFYDEILNAETWDAIYSELSHYEENFLWNVPKGLHTSSPIYGRRAASSTA